MVLMMLHKSNIMSFVPCPLECSLYLHDKNSTKIVTSENRLVRRVLTEPKACVLFGQLWNSTWERWISYGEKVLVQLSAGFVWSNTIMQPKNWIGVFPSTSSKTIAICRIFSSPWCHNCQKPAAHIPSLFVWANLNIEQTTAHMCCSALQWTIFGP